MVHLEDMNITLIDNENEQDRKILGMYSGGPNKLCKSAFKHKTCVSMAQGMISQSKYSHKYVSDLDLTVVFAYLCDINDTIIILKLLSSYHGKPDDTKTSERIEKYYRRDDENGL